MNDRLAVQRRQCMSGGTVHAGRAMSQGPAGLDIHAPTSQAQPERTLPPIPHIRNAMFLGSKDPLLPGCSWLQQAERATATLYWHGTQARASLDQSSARTCHTIICESLLALTRMPRQLATAPTTMQETVRLLQCFN